MTNEPLNISEAFQTYVKTCYAYTVLSGAQTRAIEQPWLCGAYWALNMVQNDSERASVEQQITNRLKELDRWPGSVN